MAIVDWDWQREFELEREHHLRTQGEVIELHEELRKLRERTDELEGALRSMATVLETRVEPGAKALRALLERAK